MKMRAIISISNRSQSLYVNNRVVKYHNHNNNAHFFHSLCYHSDSRLYAISYKDLKIIRKVFCKKKATTRCLIHHHQCREYSTKKTNDMSNKKKPDYWRNDGIVEGVWIFSRHGDRTPSRPLSPEHRRDDEAAYWITKLPYPDSATAFETFSKYYPVQNISTGTNKGTFIDVARNPFGFLTSKGLQQLSESGKRFFKRYNKYAYHLPNCNDWKTINDFLSVWDVQVYSTNYLRTIMSVQSFLDGLFQTHCYEPGTNFVERAFDPTIIKEIRIPTIHNSATEKDDEKEPLVRIKVRDVKHDPLNAFDRNPDLIAELVSDVMLSADFLQRDGKAAPLAARLANILPGLVRRRSRPQQKRNKNVVGVANDFSSKTPSGINWVEAADHFICRTAHNVKLAKFTDYETDDHIEEILQAMSHPTLAHLAWRFRKWYQHERLLAVIAAPPLREITDQLLRIPAMNVNDKRPFVIYSCHDITILGLLYAIRADFLATDKNVSDDLFDTSGNDSGSWRYWPPYGSNLVFELVRIPDTHDNNNESNNNDKNSHYVVRILLNGRPVRSAIKNSNTTTTPGNDYNVSTDGMLSMDEFHRVISDLESAGGYDYCSLLGLPKTCKIGD